MENPDLDILLVQLQDGRDQVRLQAVKKLAKHPSKLAKKNLVQRLKDSNSDVRYWAVMALEPLLDADVSRSLIDLLQDSSRLVRLAAVRILGKRPHKIFFGSLLDMLSDPDSDVRSMASMALSRYPEKYIPQLIRELGSSLWIRKHHCFQALQMMGMRCREAVAEALRKKNLSREETFWLFQLVGELRFRDLRGPLSEAMNRDQDVEILVAGLEALGKLGEQESVPTILGFLDHSSEKVRDACVEALSCHGEYAVTYLLEKLDDGSRAIRVSSMESLARIGDVSIAPLLENFYQRDKEGRFWILNALRRMQVEVSHSIFKSLCFEDDPDLQILSIAALCEFPWDDETLEVLLELLDHGQWRVRNEAARTLSRLKDVPASFYINQLQEGSENRKYWMIKVMENLNYEEFPRALISLFDQDSWVLKTSAADALQNFSNKDSELFLELLTSEDPNKIYWASRCLVGTMDKIYYEEMANCLVAEQSGIRENALNFFVKQGARAHGFIRHIFQERRPRPLYQAAVEILVRDSKNAKEVLLDMLQGGNREETYWGSVLASRLGEEALSAVHPLLENSDWKVRCNGIAALEQIASEKSIPILMDLLEDEYTSIRKRAIRCLGTIQARGAEEKLVPLFDSEDLELRLCVLEALANMKSGYSEELLLRALKDENWLIQLEALKGIRSMPGDQFINPLLSCKEEMGTDLVEEWTLTAASLKSVKFQDVFLKMMKDADENLLPKLIFALGEIPGKNSASVLLPLLEHENWTVVKEVVDALGKSGDKSVIQVLKERLPEADPVLKVHIKDSLRKLLGEEVWGKLLKEYLYSSKREQADRFLQEARELALDKKWKKVKSTLRKANALYEDARSLNLMARAHAELKEYDRAEKTFMKILKQKPGNQKVLFNLAMLHFLQGNHNRVENIFERIESFEKVDPGIMDLIQGTRAKIQGGS